MRVKVIVKKKWNVGAAAFIVLGINSVSGMQFQHVVDGSTGMEK